MKNNQLIEKATMTLDSLSTGGLMNPNQADAFIKMVQNAPTLLRDARVVQMKSDRQKFEKIGFGQRIMRAATEATPLSANQRAVPTTSTVELNAKEVMATIYITYDTLENNIEGARLKDSIMQMIAERAAIDIEELMINGDVNSKDTYLAQLDGLRKTATSHIVDASGDEISRTLFKEGKKALPAQYLRSPQEFRFYTSPSVETEWVYKLGDRQTAQGDKAVEGGIAKPFGIPLQSVANLQPYEAHDTEVSDILLTHPKNIMLGISRNIRIEVAKDIEARLFKIVLTTKVDTVFEEEDAVSKIIGVKE